MNGSSKNALAWLAAAMLLAGCGQTPTGPAASAGAAPSADVPGFSGVHVRYADGFLHFEAVPATPWAEAPFDPQRPGGWCFQLFINADQSATGYGPGMDYLVRAIEITPGGGVDVRLAEGGGGPGGWGESVGRVALRVNEGLIECAIPLDMLGPDDGAVDFVLETYRTVALPKDQGVRHEFVANYAGTSTPYDRTGSPVRRGITALAPEANRAR